MNTKEEKSRARAKAWRLANLDRYRASKKAHYEANKLITPQKFDSLLKGYKIYLAYFVTLAVILVLYFGEGSDLKEVSLVVGGLASFFGVLARRAQS